VQDLAQWRVAVARTEEPLERPRQTPAREDLVPGIEIEVEDLARAHAEPQREGDDAARRGAGDEIEMLGHRPPDLLFDRRQERGREHAFDPAAVDRQNAPHGGQFPRAAE
jgi:hypothetical protein